MLHPFDAFRDALAAAGLRTDDQFIDDGKIYRFTVGGDKPRSLNGWYLLHTDGVPAGAFGSWKHDIVGTWCAKSDTELTPMERTAHRQRIEAMRAEREAEQERVRQAAREKAAKIWKDLEPANDNHPYLARKQVKSFGLRESRGSLVLPMTSMDGTLQSLQFIDANGGKLFLKGGMKAGCYFKIGGAPVDRVIVAEGYATGASLHMAHGCPVAVAFDSGNLKSVADALRQRLPDNIAIELWADNDKIQKCRHCEAEVDVELHPIDCPSCGQAHRKTNVGVVKANQVAASIGAKVMIPDNPGDWNDVAVAEGIDAVRSVIPSNDNMPVAFDPGQAMVEEWVFVSALRKFIHKPTMRSVDVDAFNMEHLHIMENFPQHRKMKPAEYLRRVMNSEVVHDLMYLPTMWNGDPVFYLDGIKYLNTYNETSIPATDPNWEAHDAWQICLDHMKNILPHDWEQLLQWMAHNVQFPGKKILWAPVIVGMPGDGKTATAKVLAAAMGRKHSQVVGTQALHSEFNGWAEGKCLSIFEEIRVPGHSRHDFMNKLKTLITNDVVDVVAKGKNSKNVANTQNYIALSNFRDALALDPDDRRWGVFFTRFTSREEVTSEMSEEYWERFNDYAVRDNPEVIRGWLLSIDVSQFDRNAGPKMTQAKQYMIGRSMSSDAQSIQAILETGARGVSMNVLETKALNVALRDLENRTIQTSRMSAALAELKFEKLKDVIKWDQRKCHVWVRKPFEYDGSSQARAEIRDLLDADGQPAAFSRAPSYAYTRDDGAF